MELSGPVQFYTVSNSWNSLGLSSSIQSQTLGTLWVCPVLYSLKLLELSGPVQFYTGFALPFTVIFDLLHLSHRLKINISVSFEETLMKGVQDCMRTYHPKRRKRCATDKACLNGLLSQTVEFIITLSCISGRRKQTGPENWLSVTAGSVRTYY